MGIRIRNGRRSDPITRVPNMDGFEPNARAGLTPSCALLTGSRNGTGRGISPSWPSLAPQMLVSASCVSDWCVGVAPIPSGSDTLRTMGDSACAGIGVVTRSGNLSKTAPISCSVRGAARVFSSVMFSRMYFLAQSSHASLYVRFPSSNSGLKIRSGDPR